MLDALPSPVVLAPAFVTALVVAYGLFALGPERLPRRLKAAQDLLKRSPEIRKIRLRSPIFIPASPAEVALPVPFEVSSDGLTWRPRRNNYMGRPVTAFCPNDDVELEGRDQYGNVGTLGQHVVGESFNYYETPYCLICRKTFTLTNSATIEEAFTAAEALLDRERRRRAARSGR